MTRLYRKLRSAGQDAPPLNIQTTETLMWGGCLITFPTPFPMEQAEVAWQAHRGNVLEAWRDYWRPYGVLPVCWAQLTFEGRTQIDTTGLDGYVRDRIASIG